jgi:hypothetical protein
VLLMIGVVLGLGIVTSALLFDRRARARGSAGTASALAKQPYSCRF